MKTVIVVRAGLLFSGQVYADPITWSVIQVTNFGQGQEEGVVDPDINDQGEIVYGFRSAINKPSQIFSTIRGQLTSPADFFAADSARINNLGEVIVRGCTADQSGSCNFGIFRLDASMINLGLSMPTIHNLDFNDLGEVI